MDTNLPGLLYVAYDWMLTVVVALLDKTLEPYFYNSFDLEQSELFTNIVLACFYLLPRTRLPTPPSPRRTLFIPFFMFIRFNCDFELMITWTFNLAMSITSPAATPPIFPILFLGRWRPPGRSVSLHLYKY